ncbi:heme biosynthesis HemY N-terminal domain-containing protein [Thalassotalea aquiviva]|uniref:heme biosynthesis HemY N-terminal domain-containing protein n=1 Tax=Thalassotalea aquiviva TaxID=3242415 RepID=UPI00352B8C24
MRLLVLFILLLLGVAVAPLLIEEKGYVLISLAGYSWEMTVLGVIALLLILAFVLTSLIWFIRRCLIFGSNTWNFWLFKSERKAKNQFENGIAAFLCDDYARAENLLANSAIASKLPTTAWLVSAVSAHKQSKTAERENYLNYINDYPKAQQDFSTETLLVTLTLRLKANDFKRARDLLDHHHKLIGHDHRLLFIETKVCLHEQRYQVAIETLKQLRKQKQADSEQLTELEYAVFKAYLQDLYHQKNIAAVETAYKELSRKDRQQEGILLAYIELIAQHGSHQQADDIILPLLKKSHNEALLNKLKQLPIKVSQNVIASIQKQLLKHPENRFWLSVLAHFCGNNGEHEKARKAFISALKIRQTPEDLQRYAKLLQQLGEFEQASRAYEELVNNFEELNW